MLQYKIIEVFTSEAAHWEGKPVGEAVVEYVRGLKIAARCLVARASGGCYESGEIATPRLEILSYNMPLRITVIIPASELDRVLSGIEKMVTDGIVTVQDVAVVSHKTKKTLIPKHTRVRDAMTFSPVKVHPSTPLSEVVKLLLCSIFTGIPVVDEKDMPLGIITQGDLIYKVHLPMRLGLLARSDSSKADMVVESLGGKRAEDAMARPVICIEEDRLLTDAVDLMLRKEIKRMPVVDAGGKLVGMLSRLDVFRTVMRDAPDWEAFGRQNVQVGDLRFVSDIMRRDTHMVLPDTPVEEVIRIIDTNDLRRVAVADGNGVFLGMITERDLLLAFSLEHPDGIWEYLARRLPFGERGRKHREFKDLLGTRTAAEVMRRDVVTVREDSPIDEAIRLMVEREIKRLPVLDAEGKFKGMISRDSLLRTGFAASSCPSG